jgi:hypothetical protein
MFQELDCIALRTVKYNDRNSILTVYTKQLGRLAMLLPAGGTREAKRLRALCQPMSAFCCVVDIRPNRDIYQMRDVRPATVTSADSTAGMARDNATGASRGNTTGASRGNETGASRGNEGASRGNEVGRAGGSTARTVGPPVMSPVKSAIALFMADFLTAILREPLEDVNLFNYLELTVGELWRCPNSRVANFHLAFLLHLQHFLGIEPDWSTYTEGRVFDLADGIFRATPPLHGRYLVASEAAAAYALRRMTFRTAHIYKLSRTDRNQILDRVIQYYSTHFPGLGAVSSLDVLRSLFSF